MSVPQDPNAPSSSSYSSMSSSSSCEPEMPPGMDDSPYTEPGKPVGSSSWTGSSSAPSSDPYSRYPIRYSNGEIRQIKPGLAMRGFGQQWGHTLSYGTRLTAEYNGPNGYRWFVKEFPQARRVCDAKVTFQAATLILRYSELLSRFQHSSQRLLLSAMRRSRTLVAPVCVQNMPDSLRRWPTTERHPPSMTPEP
jgi:hypothetical protein